jgi:hypothetical protein
VGTFFGVAFKISGRDKITNRKKVVKKCFTHVCFAGMNLRDHELETNKIESLTYYPCFDRSIITNPGELDNYLNIINHIWTKTPPISLENYYTGVTVSADLSYSYILSYFSALRMLDENPLAALSIIRCYSLPWLAGYGNPDYHLLFLVGSMLKSKQWDMEDARLISFPDYNGHTFPETPSNVNKNSLKVFKDFEDNLLKEPPYKDAAHRTKNIESAMFGSSTYKDTIRGIESPSFGTMNGTHLIKEIKKWLS